jgi:hypothetical protein
LGKGNNLEIFSPKGINKILILNPKIPITSSETKFKELEEIESQMKAMNVFPDFGYE